MKQTKFLAVLALSTVFAAGCATDRGNRSASNDEREYKEIASTSDTSSTRSPSASGQDQSQSSSSSSSSGSMSQGQSMQSTKEMQDKMLHAKVLNKMHHVNQKEIKLSQLAQSKAQSQQVKSAAQHMQRDHEAMDKSLETVAMQHGIEIMSFQPADYEQKAMTEMEKLDSAQFDQAFLQDMRLGHRESITWINLYRGQVKDPAIKKLMTEALPRIQEHERMANQTQRGLASAPSESESPSSSEESQQ